MNHKEELKEIASNLKMLLLAGKVSASNPVAVMSINRIETIANEINEETQSGDPGDRVNAGGVCGR